MTNETTKKITLNMDSTLIIEIKYFNDPKPSCLEISRIAFYNQTLKFTEGICIIKDQNMNFIVDSLREHVDPEEVIQLINNYAEQFEVLFMNNKRSRSRNGWFPVFELSTFKKALQE